MNNNWNVNNRGRTNWGEPWRGGRGRGGNRGSWPRPHYCDQQMPYVNQRGGFRGGNRNNFRGRSNQGHWQNKPYRDSPGKRLSEEDIGVTEYMSDHKGFNGIIKCRYSDFQVAEINENGEIAKLTDMSPPEPPQEEAINEDEDLLLSKYNLEILPLDTWDRINELVVNSQPANEIVEVDVTGMTKEQRTKIHDAVKKAFGTSIVGSTVAVDDKKIVRFEKYRKGVRRDNRVKWVWPAEYVYFIVHKENCDTMEAAARLAEKLRLNIKPSMLGYAGTKDRRAKTSQWFSLRKVDPRKIAAAAKDIRDVHVGNFSFSPISLKLGMLRGNRFRIALRNVTAPDEVVAEACSRLQRHGFVNYYGLQRFGSRPNAPTYEVGRLLLQADYRQAIKHIVADEEMVRVGGARGAGGARLLRALDANPRDMLGALDQLARNQRVLYLHAYQSLVWNRCASERLRRLGLAPAKGDLVPLHPDAREYENEQESEDEIKEEDESITEDNDIETPIADADKDKEVKEVTAENPEKKVQTKNEPKPKVPMKVLTEEDVASGSYTIFDVVLPVPGYNIEYPPNMVDYYKELLEKDNLKLEMRHKNKSFSLCGAYRSLAVRPGALRWQTARYSEPTADLLLSDLQRLRGAPAAAPGQPDGPYKALLLTMTLPASSYATMALRELMKVDTANDSQALQNDYHKRPHAAATALVKPSEELKAPKAEEEESAADGAQEETSIREALSIQGGAEETRDDVEMKQGVASEPNGDRAEKRKMEDETEEGVKKPKQEVDNADDGK